MKARNERIFGAVGLLICDAAVLYAAHKASERRGTNVRKFRVGGSDR